LDWGEGEGREKEEERERERNLKFTSGVAIGSESAVVAYP